MYKSDTEHRDLPNRAELTVFNGEVDFAYHIKYVTTTPFEEAEKSIDGKGIEYSIHEDGRFLQQ